MRLSRSAALLLSFCSWGCKSEKTQPTTDPHLASGLRLLSTAPAAALAELRQATKPDAAANICAQGLALEGLGQREQAVERLERCKALEPSYAPGRTALGRLRAYAGKLNDARDEWEAARAADPTDLGPLLLLATSAQDSEQLKAALAALRRWNTQRDGHPGVPPTEYWLTLTWLERQIGERPEAARAREAKTSTVANPKATTVQAALARLLDRDELALALLHALSKTKGIPVLVLRELIDVALELKQFQLARDAVVQLPVHPPDYENLILNARVQLATNNAVKAKSELDAAKKLTPSADEDPHFLSLVASAQSQLGEHAAALATLQKLEELRPGDVDVQIQLASAQAAMADRASATERLRTAAQGARTDPSALPRIASAQLAIGAPADAATTYEMLLAVRPTSAETAIALADALTAAGKTAQAVSVLERAVRNASDPIKALNRLVKLHVEARRGRDALAAIDAYQGDRRVAATILKAQTLAQLGRADEAQTVLVGLTTESPQELAAWLALAHWYSKRKKLQLARETFAKSVALDPNSKRAHQGLAETHLALHETAQAAAQYEWLANAEENYLWLNNAASLYAEVPASVDRAVDLAQRAFELAPERPEVADTLGWALLRRGKAADADRCVALLRKAHTALRSAETAFHYGSALLHAGQVEQGKELLREAVKRADASAPWRPQAVAALAQ